MNTFRVLVLDDSRELIAKIAKRVSHQQNVDGIDWRVVLQEVHAEVTVQEGSPQFSEKTLGRIVEACREQPQLIRRSGKRKHSATSTNFIGRRSFAPLSGMVSIARQLRRVTQEFILGKRQLRARCYIDPSKCR